MDENYISKTLAVVLRISPFSNTSHIVTWLTPEYGKITTVVKGACRPKSLFLGQYDLGYTCELLFYTRERGGIHIIKECSPLKERSSLRTNWRAAFCLSYICHLSSLVSVEGVHHRELYDALISVLDFLDSGSKSLSGGVLWFELRLAQVIGIAPRLSHCVACNRTLGGIRNVFFSPARGGLVCLSCNKAGGSDAQALRPDILAMLHRWQKADSPTDLKNIKHSQNQITGFWNLIGPFLVYHLDLATECRRTVFQMLTT